MLAPEEFELPRRAEGGWIIGTYHYPENPRYTVPSQLTQLCRRWLQVRAMAAVGARGMIAVSGAPIMPLSGGYLEQTAFIMDAFALFDRWLQERREDG